MKVLVSASACTPYAGSENYIGWSAVCCLARDHDLWVLVSGRNRPDIERAQSEGLVPPNVHFAYTTRFQPWHSNRMKARLQSWTEYQDFSRDSLALARELHTSVGFDLVHHVTIATWRIASPLWQLGVPLILGPVGGNERFPFQLYPILSPSAMMFELVRSFSNLVSRNSPRIRKCARQAAHVLAANAETVDLLKQLRGRAAGVSLLSPAFYSQAKINAFMAAASGRNFQGPLRFFAGGMLEGRKGIALALQALARLKKQGLQFSYHVGGGGPEFNHMRRLAEQLGIKDNLVFDRWSGAVYLQELGGSHVFLLPSLRESTGLTMMEAMLAGCVPVVADCGGPGHIVTPGCGYKIPVTSRKTMIDKLVAAISELDRNRSLLQQKGSLAAQRIATSFSEESYRKTINIIYRQVVADVKHAGNNEATRHGTLSSEAK